MRGDGDGMSQCMSVVSRFYHVLSKVWNLYGFLSRNISVSDFVSEIDFEQGETWIFSAGPPNLRPQPGVGQSDLEVRHRVAPKRFASWISGDPVEDFNHLISFNLILSHVIS